MLFHQVLIMFIAVLLLKTVVPAHLLDTNLTFYLALITLLLIFQNLCKNAFPTGYFSLTDETKMQVLFAVKSFIVVWVAFSYSEGSVESFLGLEIEASHKQLVSRLNHMASLGKHSFSLDTEFSYVMLAGMAAMISFVIVKINVNFAFYYFVISRTASRASSANFLDSQAD